MYEYYSSYLIFWLCYSHSVPDDSKAASLLNSALRMSVKNFNAPDDDDLTISGQRHLAFPIDDLSAPPEYGLINTDVGGRGMFTNPSSKVAYRLNDDAYTGKTSASASDLNPFDITDKQNYKLWAKMRIQMLKKSLEFLGKRHTGRPNKRYSEFLGKRYSDFLMGKRNIEWLGRRRKGNEWLGGGK